MGTIDAYIRIAAGLLLLAFGSAGRLGRIGSPIAVVVGASKVAEGVTRYCPLNDLLAISTVEGSKRLDKEQAADIDEMIDKAETIQRDFPWERPNKPLSEQRINRTTNFTS